jgi:hypothetical protein
LPKQRLDIGQAVIYKGPYSEVHDDEGHVYPRGIRIAVSDRSFELLTGGPLKGDFIGINPAIPKAATEFCAPAGTTRPASETKGSEHVSGSGSSCC